MKRYDPTQDPGPDQWLALSEQARIDLAEAFHKRSGGFGQNLRMHAVTHVVVENQVAMGQPIEARDALARLLRDGLDRHDAIHAIGSVLVKHLFPVLKARNDPPAFDNASYVRALAGLTADEWRSGG